MHEFLYLNAAFVVRPSASAGRKLVAFRVPKALAAVVDKAAKRKDTDRSKWIREAMREKVLRESRA